MVFEMPLNRMVGLQFVPQVTALRMQQADDGSKSPTVQKPTVDQIKSEYQKKAQQKFSGVQAELGIKDQIVKDTKCEYLETVKDQQQFSGDQTDIYAGLEADQVKQTKERLRKNQSRFGGQLKSWQKIKKSKRSRRSKEATAKRDIDIKKPTVNSMTDEVSTSPGDDMSTSPVEAVTKVGSTDGSEPSDGSVNELVKKLMEQMKKFDAEIIPKVNCQLEKSEKLGKDGKRLEKPGLESLENQSKIEWLPLNSQVEQFQHRLTKQQVEDAAPRTKQKSQKKKGINPFSASALFQEEPVAEIEVDRQLMKIYVHQTGGKVQQKESERYELLRQKRKRNKELLRQAGNDKRMLQSKSTLSMYRNLKYSDIQKRNKRMARQLYKKQEQSHQDKLKALEQEKAHLLLLTQNTKMVQGNRRQEFAQRRRRKVSDFKQGRESNDEFKPIKSRFRLSKAKLTLKESPPAVSTNSFQLLSDQEDTGASVPSKKAGSKKTKSKKTKSKNAKKVQELEGRHNAGTLTVETDEEYDQRTRLPYVEAPGLLQSASNKVKSWLPSLSFFRTSQTHVNVTVTKSDHPTKELRDNPNSQIQHVPRDKRFKKQERQESLFFEV